MGPATRIQDDTGELVGDETPVTTRAEQRRTQRRRQHVETARRGDSPKVDHDAVPQAELIEARNATVRVIVAVACLLGAQFLHWSVIDQHAQEWSASGDFFFILALLEGVMTVLVIARLRPWVAATGIVLSAIPVMVWLWDRTLGLPFGPNKGIRGTIGRSDVMSVLFELITIVALWPFLRPGYGARRPVRLDLTGRIVVGATCVYVVGFSYWAMIGDQGAIHKHTAVAANATVPGTDQTSATTTTLGPLNSSVVLVPTQTLSYTATEYAFTGPATVPAGVTRIVLQNQGVEAHDLQVARIPDSSPTPSNLANLEIMFDDAQAGRASAPTIVADSQSTQPGQTTTQTVELTPGRYILGCPNVGSDGAPHYTKGMIMVLEVTDAPGTVTPTT